MVVIEPIAILAIVSTFVTFQPYSTSRTKGFAEVSAVFKIPPFLSLKHLVLVTEFQEQLVQRDQYFYTFVKAGGASLQEVNRLCLHCLSVSDVQLFLLW